MPHNLNRAETNIQSEVDNVQQQKFTMTISNQPRDKFRYISIVQNKRNNVHRSRTVSKVPCSKLDTLVTPSIKNYNASYRRNTGELIYMYTWYIYQTKY